MWELTIYDADKPFDNQIDVLIQNKVENDGVFTPWQKLLQHSKILESKNEK